MKSKTSLLLFVPFLLHFENCRAEPDFSSRRLGGELNVSCPADDLNDAVADNSYAGLLDNYVSIGTNLVEKVRTKPESYYENLVEKYIILFCDVETASERCVDENSAFAAKDWSGESCIKAADHDCPIGTCERSSNCYWNSVQEGQNRTTRFRVNDYEDAASGEMHVTPRFYGV